MINGTIIAYSDRFWKEIGCSMSKVSLSEPSVVHLIESNVAGNRQGIEVSSAFLVLILTHLNMYVLNLKLAY